MRIALPTPSKYVRRGSVRTWLLALLAAGVAAASASCAKSPVVAPEKQVTIEDAKKAMDEGLQTTLKEIDEDPSLTPAQKEQNKSLVKQVHADRMKRYDSTGDDARTGGLRPTEQ